MTARRLFLILASSAIVALLSQWSSIRNRHLNINQLTAIACDMVSARAQAGSTRDVHDQLYSFWHKHSSGFPVEILVRRGEKEVGAHTSTNQKNIYTQNCQIENRPDYEISFQFQDENILSLSLIEKFAAVFIVLLMMFFALRVFLRSVRELWFGQVLHEIRLSLNLDTEPIAKSNLLSRFLAKVFLNSASSLKPTIEKLQISLSEKQSELIESKDLVSKLEDERIRANTFANMVTMVRHDLKGPLSTLKITASEITQLLEESTALRYAITSIEKIISDLDQKKTEATLSNSGKLMLEIVEVAIQEVVDEKSSVLASHNDVKIEFEYNPNRLSPVMCDPNHLRRIVANLLQNAIEASPKSSLVRVGVRQKQDDVLIEVADQGGGIAPEILPRLFERGATFGKTNGTGEGLSYVKSRAASFGGSIAVAETSAEGTVFQLKLPLAITKALFQATPSEEAQEKMAILDDEIEFQKLAWTKKPGHREYFSSPHSFLSWIEDTQESAEFSCIVDLHLGSIVSGIDVIRSLGRNQKAYLATSDYLNPQAIELSEELGISIIPKALLLK